MAQSGLRALWGAATSTFWKRKYNSWRQYSQTDPSEWNSYVPWSELYIIYNAASRSQRGNIAAAVKVEQIYCSPFLFSGIGSLVLSKQELNILDQHNKNHLQNLLKLHENMSWSFVYLLAGCILVTAVQLLHQLTLFGMIGWLPDDHLKRIARTNLTASRPSEKSWFIQIHDICLKYNLPNLTHKKNHIC